MCLVIWLHCLPGGLPDFFPPTNIYGVSTVYDQHSPKQDQEAYSQFQKVILV